MTNAFLGAPAVNQINYGALFLQFLDKKILLESGFGADYTDGVWGSAGPAGYVSAVDHPVVRLQIKPISGLNFGFAFGEIDTVHTTPSPLPNGLKANLSKLSFGVRYDYPADTLPITAGAGFSLVDIDADAEEAYLGAGYVILKDMLTASVDAKLTSLGDFSNIGTILLNENAVFTYTKGLFTGGLTITNNNTFYAGGGPSIVNLVFDPYVQYDVVEKVFRAKLAANITKGLGESNKEDYSFTVTPSLFYSVKGAVTSYLPDFTGFQVAYKFGLAQAAGAKTTTNSLSLGFRAAF
jgi:hypothetical protein